MSLFSGRISTTRDRLQNKRFGYMIEVILVQGQICPISLLRTYEGNELNAETMSLDVLRQSNMLIDISQRPCARCKASWAEPPFPVSTLPYSV